MPLFRSDKPHVLKGLVFISPWLLGFCFFTLIPIVLSLYYSFCDYKLLQPAVFRGLENYQLLWNDPLFWKALANTFYFAAVALPVGLLAALTAALLLNAKITGQSAYRTMIFLPSLVPAVASGMLWLWLLNSKLGLINLALVNLGISNPPGWLVESRWVMPALVLMSVWGVGNTVVIYLAGLQDVPRELYEAASIDGASGLRQIWHITLPSISPVIFFNLIMGIIGTMQVFSAPFILFGGGGGPENSAYFFTSYLYDNAFTFLKMGYASAMAWVQLLIILLLTGIAFWTSKRWVHVQGK